MPRKPRFFIPGLPAHVVQRGNNRQAIFFEEADYRVYLSLLNGARDRYGCAIHAYVLMTNHVHLLATPEDKHSVSRMMQYVGRHYVPYINKKYGRSGTLWEGRFKASIVDSSEYLLACYRYIELNPVRAGMVDQPGGYVWSSYRYNALEGTDGLITPHAEYLKLGASFSERASHYRTLYEKPVEAEQMSDLRAYVQSGTPLGNNRFRNEIEAALSVKVGQASRGRPKESRVSTINGY
jgi:putative transposase